MFPTNDLWEIAGRKTKSEIDFANYSSEETGDDALVCKQHSYVKYHCVAEALRDGAK